jgi:hypothetical protein
MDREIKVIQKKMNPPETFGNSFLGIVVAILLIVIMAHGEPDVIDAIRIIFLNWAGIE